MKQQSQQQFTITWHDKGLEPSCAPDPRWPNGIDLDLSNGRMDCCTVELSYPAKRIGHYLIDCRLCDQRIACSTAGRRDDPRSLTMACKLRPRAA